MQLSECGNPFGPRRNIGFMHIERTNKRMNGRRAKPTSAQCNQTLSSTTKQRGCNAYPVNHNIIWIEKVFSKLYISIYLSEYFKEPLQFLKNWKSNLNTELRTPELPLDIELRVSNDL